MSHVLIVIILMHSAGPPSVTSTMQEFDTKKACEKAASVYRENMSTILYQKIFNIACVPKS